MLHNRLLLSVVGLLTTLVVCVVYLVGSVLDLPLTGGRTQVGVDLENTGGLFEGSAVTYRGVRVGTVDRIHLDEGGAEATVTLREGAEVPTATSAVVRSLSPVGEQYLDFQPDAHAGPWLADGDRIEASATELPVSLAAAADSFHGLLGQIDEDELRTVLAELNTGLSGVDGDLERLLDSSDALVGTLDESWPETRRLLHQGRDVGRLLESHQGNLTGFSRSARVLARWLKGFDADFQQILADAPGDFRTVRVLVDDLAGILPPFLDTLLHLTGVLYQREPHLRELTTALPWGAGRFASVFRDGWLNVDLSIAGQRQCHYDTERQDPMTGERRPLDTRGRCALDDQVWRGTEQAPPPLDR